MSDCKHDLPKKMCADCHASDLEAEVERLTQERDEARRERDESIAAEKRKDADVDRYIKERNEARAEVERLVALLRRYEGKMAPDDVLRSEAEAKALRVALEEVLPFVLFLPVQSSVIEDGLAAARRARAALAGVKG